MSRSPTPTAADALDGPAISEEEHEVVLHEDEVVVDKQAVAKERVRMGTETVTEDRRCQKRSARSRSRPKAPTACDTERTADRAATR